MMYNLYIMMYNGTMNEESQDNFKTVELVTDRILRFGGNN